MDSKASTSDPRTRDTALDALTSKASACALDYFEDPYLLGKHFVDHSSKGGEAGKERGAVENDISLDKVMHNDRSPLSLPSASCSIASAPPIPAAAPVAPGSVYRGPTVRRSPIMNRGYTTRVVVFRRVIDEFLACTIFAESLGHESAPAANIISLGGGFDSVCFNYLSKCKHRLLFTEVDFKEIVDRKASLIVSDAILNGATQGFAAFDIDRAVLSTDISSYRNSYGYKFGDLRLIEADLRHAEDLRSKLMESGIDTTAPTLIISECVLLYLHKIDTERLSATLGALFPRALWVSYDAVQPNDVFGRMMHSNLVDAGFAIPGFRAYPSIDAHLMRYRTICGWNGGSSAGCTMTEAHDKVLDESCRRKADSIERLDELEEWTMLMNHYCITIGSSCGEFNHIVEIFRTIK